MTQFEQLDGVVSREELLEHTRTLDEAIPVDYEYKHMRFNVNNENKVIVVSHRDAPDQFAPVILDDTSLARVSREVGLNKYISKIPMDRRAELVIPHLNFWFPESQPNKRLRLLQSNGEAIMSIPNADFEHVNIEELIAGIEGVLGDHNILGYHKLNIGPKAITFSLLTDHTEMVINDHIYNAGIRVSHSIDGSTSTRVEPYLFNQWCANGCTHEHSIKAWNRRPTGRPRGGGDAAPMMGLSTWLQESVVNAVMLFDQEVINLQRLAGMPVPHDADEALSKLLTANGVPVKLQGAVKEQLEVDGFENMYDLYQAITHVETHNEHFEDHPNAKGKLNKMAAHLSHHTTFCPQCSTQLEVFDALEQLNQVDED